MTPRTTLAALIPVVFATVVLAACGGSGDDGEETGPGNLTNPRQVPTATIDPSPAPVIIIDPNAIQPLPAEGPPPSTAGPDASGGASATPAAGSCGPTYTVTAGDTFSLIAEKCGTTTQAIVDANPQLDARTLHIGDVVNIPQ